MRAIGLLAAGCVIGVGGYATAKMMLRRPTPPFELEGAAIGAAKPAAATAASLTASRIAATADGALVIDADSGALVRTDASGKAIAQLAIGRDAGLLAYDADANRAYIADRRGDRIAVVHVGDTLEVVASWTTPAEPYGVALTPDRATVLVTTIAGRTLVALDAQTGAERWRVGLAAEPRGLAVSPDGTRALVANLATGAVDSVALADGHAVTAIALETPQLAEPAKCKDCGEQPKTYDRAAFAVTFMGAHEAVIPYQRETPIQIASGGNTGGYGGGFEPPITQELAFVGDGTPQLARVSARILAHQPRALAWDGAHDALYIAGIGTDFVLQLRDASTTKIALGVRFALDTGAERCGPDGLAVAPDGSVLVWCAFSRRVARAHPIVVGKLVDNAKRADLGPTLVASAWTPDEHAGFVTFHSAELQISDGSALACASCHPDGRADGLSWQIDKHPLQTPILAGRVVGTAPYKWDGSDRDLTASMASTMKRLGGIGLDKPATTALVAYLEAIPAVRAPVRDVAIVMRGKQLFESAGCSSCHNGVAFTDGARHKLDGTLAQVDTPSLRGLAASAPYYHDGSAPTLEALLRGDGAVRGMADTSKLTAPQIADLAAYLETL